jgi:putative hemolysin
MDVALRILALLALILGNAFFVMCEYCIVTARRVALQARAEAGSRGARAALRLLDDPVRVMSTVQVGISALAILTGAIGEPLVRNLLGTTFPAWIDFAIAFIVVTYLAVVLGELVPKALTLAKAETIAVLLARPIEGMAAILRPAAWVLEASAAVLLRPFGVRDVMAGGGVRSPEELRAVVDEAEEGGVIPRGQEELLHNVFELSDLDARDVMVPAPDVEWLDAGLSARAALDRVIETPHQRYPVGDGTLDRLVGIVHVRDLLAASRDGNACVREVARDALIVPTTKRLTVLLRELRERKTQIAVVVDEYGGTAGIVSIHDLLEELVGEIENEYDVPADALHWLDDRTVEAPGSLTIDDFEDVTGFQLPERGPRTLGGLAFDALGRRPEVGDEAEAEGARLKVLELDGLRITKLQLTLPEGFAREDANPS